MPVDRLYQGTEPIAHPLTGELIELDDRDGLFRAWCDGENHIRKSIEAMSGLRRDIRRLSDGVNDIRAECDRIVYALAGQDVTRGAARDFARDEIDQGC